jgi:hypothetical protein
MPIQCSIMPSLLLPRFRHKGGDRNNAVLKDPGGCSVQVKRNCGSGWEERGWAKTSPWHGDIGTFAMTAEVWKVTLRSLAVRGKFPRLLRTLDSYPFYKGTAAILLPAQRSLFSRFKRAGRDPLTHDQDWSFARKVHLSLWQLKGVKNLHPTRSSFAKAMTHPPNFR